MQEDIEHRSVTLVVNTTKMTARALKNVILKYLSHRKAKRQNRNMGNPSGKQTVKQLLRQGQGVSNIEITDQNIKSFERVARKYGVDFALKKDSTGSKPKYLVFFKSRDADALTSAFKEYSAGRLKHQNRPSMLAGLSKFKAMMKPRSRIKQKELER